MAHLTTAVFTKTAEHLEMMAKIYFRNASDFLGAGAWRSIVYLFHFDLSV